MRKNKKNREKKKEQHKTFISNSTKQAKAES